ncbi:hypothetical protein GCM10009780_03210 [Actinomadura alba]
MIDPGAIPIPQVKPNAVEAAGRALKTDGANIAETGSDIHSGWQGLAAFYRAPEAARLFAATRPVRQAGEDLDRAATTAGDALITFADEVRPIVQRLNNLHADATRFRGEIAGDEDWRGDEDKIERHNILIGAVEHAVAQYQAAERTCANKITAIFGGTRFVAAGSAPPGAGELAYGGTYTPEDNPTPWGSPQQHDKPWYQDAWDGVYDFGSGIVTDLGGLTGLYGENGWVWAGGEWGDWWGNAKDSWVGMGKGLAGLAGFYGPDGWGWQGWGNTWNNWKEVGHAFVPWREYGDRPGYVWTQSLLNIGSCFLGGAGLIKGGAQALSRIGRKADVDAPEIDLTRPDADLNLPNTPGDRMPTTQDIRDAFDDLDFDNVSLDLDRALDDADRLDDRQPVHVGGRDENSGGNGHEPDTGSSGSDGRDTEPSSGPDKTQRNPRIDEQLNDGNWRETHYRESSDHELWRRSVHAVDEDGYRIPKAYYNETTHRYEPAGEDYEPAEFKEDPSPDRQRPSPEVRKDYQGLVDERKQAIEDVKLANQRYDSEAPDPSAEAIEERRRAYEEQTRIGEELGERAAADAVRDHFGKDGHIVEQIPLPPTKNGSGCFDQIWTVKDPATGEKRYVVVEAKSPNADLGLRRGPDAKLLEQGHPDYFKSILREMRRRGGDERALADDLQEALEDRKLDYVMSRAHVKIDPKTGNHAYDGYTLKHFDISDKD